MWEPGSGGSSTSSNGNRGVLLLITALSFCVLLYKAWGPLLLITCALVLVVHTCYSLLVNDSLLAPHTLVLLRYACDLGLELAATVKLLATVGLDRSQKVFKYLRSRYEERRRRLQRNEREAAAAAAAAEEEEMNGRRRSSYRLSTTGTDFTENVSPMNIDPYHSFALNGACDIARTSTPLSRGATWKKGVQQNGNLGLFTPTGTSPAKKLPPLRTENRQSTSPHLRTEETHYSPKGSPWGNSISPKMRDRAAGIKTVQTVAGPLLASTRYNIDPKVYTDVSSPGLTSRLTKYATEASNKLTHQPQYGTGQFPKVNLNASPIPLLSPKVARARMPVTVRVAPPEMTSYSPPDATSHQERHKIFSNTSGSEIKESKSCPSVAQVLKEISLKRHASREDIMLDLAKKQRTERIEGQLENLEEMMQKRARDESVTSEEDASPQSKTQRPTKRSKASSCHDILNSLSSSVNVLSGVKRKAMDTSRCNTPDIEKHFKSSSKSPNRSSSLTLQTSGEIVKSKEQLNVKVPVTNASGEPHQYKTQEKIVETPKTDKSSSERQQTYSSKTLNLIATKVHKEISDAPPAVTKLTDKLFMRAEPQTSEKFKNLIEDQESIEAKFKTDDKDEIKKQDIVNMRQNSMRQRLQSMFDAISGKSASKIDPDVVIQAEEVNPPASTTYTTLSSLTTTTTVNTSPITTTIVPILKTDTDTKSPTTKHVTFNLPTATTSFSSATISTTSSITGSILSPSNKDAPKSVEPKPLGSGTSSFVGFNAKTNSAPSFNFGNNAVTSSVPVAVSSSSKPIVQPTTSGFSFSSGNTVIDNTTTPAATTTTAVTATTIAVKNTSPEVTSAPNINNSGTSFTGFAFPKMTSAPVATFGPMSTTPAKSTEMSLGNVGTSTSFGNTLAKSTTNTSIAQTTSLPNFGSEKKEAGFSFMNPSSTSINSSCIGNTTTTTMISNSPASIFSVSAAKTMFSAGSNSVPNLSNPSAVTSTIATTSAATPIFSFNAANSKPAGGFSFGQKTSAASSTAPSAPGVFGTGAHTLSNVSSNSGTATFATPLAPGTMGTMGSSAVTATNPTFNSSSPSLFSSSTNAPSLFSGSSASGATSMFKSPSVTTTPVTATTTSIFGTQTNSTPNFGVTPITTTTSTPNLFGNNASINATTTSTIPSLFGNVAAGPTVAATTAATPTISAFGGSTVQQQTTPQGNIFGGVNTTTTTSPSIFGSAASTSPTGLFSGSNTNANPAVSNMASTSPADNTSIFGQTKSPTLSFGTTNPTFGANNSSSTFSAPNVSTGTSAFQIGSTPSASTSLPSFSTVKPTPQFGAPTNPSVPANASGSIFGATTGGFGATPNPAPSAFGTTSTTSAFGMPNITTAAPTAFGTNPPSFGSSTTATSPFGAQTTTAPTLFGNIAPGAVATGATTSFSFGGGQQTQQPQQQHQQQAQQPPAASFSFGGAANTNTASPGGLFQFGGPSAPKPAGFNFSAPTAAPSINFSGAAPGAPPTFNAPATNMFSIGSGSSTPRSRTSRQRRQR